MNKIHGKSKCCQAKIYRFGGKRRQCASCGHTWSIYPRKRGRSRLRHSPELLHRIVLGKTTLTALAKALGLTVPAVSYRIRRLLRHAVAQMPAVVYPPLKVNLILLVDGLWFRFRGQIWVLYLTAVKPSNQSRAFFMDPILLPGRENLEAWKQVFEAIPPEIKKRIRALVADHFRGVKGIARKNGWVLQLCHFHLIAQLYRRKGTRNMKLPGRTIRETFYNLVREALEIPEGKQLHVAIQKLHQLLRQPVVSKGMTMVVREFLKELSAYRAYQRYPNLYLPTTTGSVESMGRIIRDMVRRARNFRSPRALQLWATTLIRLRPEVQCNGKHFSTEFF